ncbi:glycosyltransferase family 4 protein [Phenylobacterium sp.]|jgi:glycosyltransferase involved in cell wall biosynthesis|uniref:glycosyltransferase family 4 protein n=1 Tax=Phenylobacterium sp. TaxID=1871053 RepID=UPI002F3F0CA7
MTNAAILLHPDAFETDRPRLLGRHAAGESFLRGFLRHAEVDRFYFWRGRNIDAATLEAAVRALEPIDKPIRWFADFDRPQLHEVGVVALPGPNLDTEAWARRPFGGGAYSLCGLTHTTATARTMTTLANFLIAPVEPHDALICTSRAVRASVEAQLEGVRDYLASEYPGPRRRGEPLLATIPLGINTEQFETRPADRKAWRERLDIPEDAVVALYVGRFNAVEKMNPALMALSLERAAQRCAQRLVWVNAGWASQEDQAEAYHAAVRALCPSVGYRVVDGRPADVRFSIWSVADLFISFSDNIQESFGLTPVEAMAAGLPSVVTDWDGYRDTVRDGEDGFRIDTAAPAPGSGFDMAYWHAHDWWTYPAYVGSVAQLTAIDLDQAADAIAALAANPELRRAQGERAKARAKAVFDWSAIIPQYQALWAEQTARRQAAASAPPAANDPFRPDPFTLFAAYPTRHLAATWRAAVPAGMTWPVAAARLAGPLAAFGAMNRPTLQEAEEIVAWLAEQPGLAVAEIAARFPANRRNAITRGLLWLARFGVIALTPA